MKPHDTTATSSSSTNSTATDSSASWADSVQPLVWLEKSEKNRSRKRSRSVASSRLLPALISAAVMLVSVVLASVNLLAVYSSAILWVRSGVVAAIVGTAIALIPMSRTLRRWGILLQSLALLLAQLVVGPTLCLPETNIAGGFLPSLDTLARGAIDTITSFKYVIAVQPPLGTESGAAMALWTLCLWSSFLAATFAVIPKHRVFGIAAAAVILAEEVTAILLGTSSGFYPVASGIVITVLLFAWGSWYARGLETRSPLKATILLVAGIVCALALGMTIPSTRTVLREVYEPPLSPYDYSSPLSGLRSFIKDHKNEVLLTVTNLPEKTPVRLAVMDSFDGVVWNLSDSATSSGSADYERVGSTLATGSDTTTTTSASAATDNGTPFTATFTVEEGFRQVWFPLAGSPSSVTFSASTTDTTAGKGTGSATGTAEAGAGTSSTESDGELYFNASTDTALYPRRTQAGMRYSVTGTIPKTPSDAAVAKAVAENISQPATHDVPTAIGTLAQAWAGSAGSDGAAAQKLTDQLRSTGWFSHGLQGDYHSLAGHGTYRLNQLLDGGSMVGDSEQYASAMALMARDLGLPSRVVLGFVPKDDAGDISAARTETVGDHTTTSFTGNDIEAWVEINLTGYGWVSFYPTPEETKVPDENQNTTPPDPQTLVRQPSVPLEDPLRDEQNSAGTSLEGAPDTPAATDPNATRVLEITRTVALYGSPVWLVLLGAAAILLIKWIFKRRQARRGTSRGRIENGWRYLSLLSGWSGTPTDPHSTRREQQRAMEAALKLPTDSLKPLSSMADRASFAPDALSDAAATEYWKTVGDLEKKALAAMPLRHRWRTKLSVRGLLSFVRPAFPKTNNLPESSSATNAQEPSAPRTHRGGVRLSQVLPHRRALHPRGRNDA